MKEDLVIYLDMDGVVVNFVDPALKLLGLTRKDFDYGNYNGFGLTKNNQKKNRNLLWENIRNLGEKFWENLPELLDFKYVYKELSTFAPTYICTASGLTPSACSGKLKWLQNRLGKNFNNYIMINDKYLLANKNSILIDDSIKNIELFREKGGRIFKWLSNWEIENYTKKVVNDNLLDLAYFLENLK